MPESSKENWVTLSSTDEIEIDQIKTVQAGPKKIILVRTESGYFALDSLCPHQGASFEDGDVCKGDRIRCARHGYLFNLKTGNGHGNEYFVETFPVRESDGKIKALLPQPIV